MKRRIANLFLVTTTLTILVACQQPNNRDTENKSSPSNTQEVKPDNPSSPSGDRDDDQNKSNGDRDQDRNDNKKPDS